MIIIFSVFVTSGKDRCATSYILLLSLLSVVAEAARILLSLEAGAVILLLFF